MNIGIFLFLIFKLPLYLGTSLLFSALILIIYLFIHLKQISKKSATNTRENNIFKVAFFHPAWFFFYYFLKKKKKKKN